MNKDYLFGANEPGQGYQVRADSRERDYRNQQFAYDRQQVGEVYNSNGNKRELLWEMKKNQRFNNNYEAPGQYEPAFMNQNTYDPPYGQNYPMRDYPNQENYYIESKIEQPSYSPSPQQRKFNNIDPSPQDFNPNDMAKRIELEKKRNYAEELKRQIEERNMIKASEGRNPVRRENPESEPRARFASADRQSSNIFGNDSQKMSEREKKLKYARELEAQINQKKQVVSSNPERVDQFFNLDRENQSIINKQKYARELEEQIRSKNNRASENQRENFQNRRIELEENRNKEDWQNRNQDDSLKFEGNKPEIDKKLRYRQELEKQIEEQKKRKEDEKKRKMLEEQIAEVPLLENKKSEPRAREERKPREDKNFKETPDPPFQEIQKNISNQNLYKFDKRAEIHEPIIRKEPNFEEPPLEPQLDNRKIGQFELPNQYPRFRPANEILAPMSQEKAYRNMENVKYVNPEPAPNTLMIEKYLKEIQDVRKERDLAREQCLEMREMMLREKEKNLEQMLNLMRNQNTELNQVDNRLVYERPPVYPVKSLNSLDSRKDLERSPFVKPSNDYAQAAFEMVKKDLFMPDEGRPGKDLYGMGGNFNEQERNMYENQKYARNNQFSEPRIDYNKIDYFEKSLASHSKFIEPTVGKWTAQNVNEPEGLAEMKAEKLKPRKKWETGDQGYDVGVERKPVVMEKYGSENRLDEIAEDDESLPGHDTMVGFNDSRKQKIEDDYMKDFKEKYINQGDKNNYALNFDQNSLKNSSEMIEFKNLRDNPDIRNYLEFMEKNPEPAVLPLNSPVKSDLFDKVFSTEDTNPMKASSRKNSARGGRAFSRISEAQKHASSQEVIEKPYSLAFNPNPNSEL